jgi:AcrR family transcriptional regulator
MKATTRKEQQAETRSRLMSSAAKLFSRRGLENASIEEVSRDAGYTKGAFYANFRSKEELFLAMMDEKFSAEIERLDAALHTDEGLEDQIRSAGIDWLHFVRSDPEWTRLYSEFAIHATRDEEFRQEFMTRVWAMRERIIELYRRYLDEHGIEPPMPVEQIALATSCLANGFLNEQMLDPTVDDELYGTMLITFFRGIGAMLEEQDPAAFERITGSPEPLKDEPG